MLAVQSWPSFMFHDPTAGGSALCHLQVPHYCCPSSLCPGPPKRFLETLNLPWKHSRTILSCLCLPLMPSRRSIHSSAPLMMDENRQKLPLVSLVKKRGEPSVALIHYFYSRKICPVEFLGAQHGASQAFE